MTSQARHALGIVRRHFGGYFELGDTCREMEGVRRVLISEGRQPRAAFQAFPCGKQEPLPGASVSLGGRHLLEPYFKLICLFCPCLLPELSWKPCAGWVRPRPVPAGRARRSFVPSGGKRDLEGGSALRDGMVFINTTESQLLIILMLGNIGRAAARIQRGSAQLVLHHTLCTSLGNR